tara:strand:+ start:31 stop:615 length:585 start_codon:yes stop_codon:yes gene_type:complete
MKKVLLLLLLSIFIYFLYTDNFIGGKSKGKKTDTKNQNTAKTQKNKRSSSGLTSISDKNEYNEYMKNLKKGNKNKVRVANKNIHSLEDTKKNLGTRDLEALQKEQNEKDKKKQLFYKKTQINRLEKQRSNSDYMHESQYEDEKNKNKVHELNKNSGSLINYLEGNKKTYEEYAEIVKKQDNFAVKYIKKLIAIL